jgi:DNA-binding NarL/FixJ family response regulator
LRDFGALIRRLVHRELMQLPLAVRSARIRARCPRGVPLPRLGAVRGALARTVVDDMMQEVSIAIWLTLLRGGIRAARPVVHRWLRTSVPRIVRHNGQNEAFLALLSAPCEQEAMRELGVVPAAQEVEADSEDGSGANILGFDQRLVDKLPRRQRETMTLVLAGVTNAEISKRLNIRPVTVRVHLARARRCLDALRLLSHAA